MTREQAYSLLTKYLHNKNLLKHCLSCEAGMKALYRKLHPQGTPEEEEKWGITGLLHDVDYEIAQERNMLEKHGTLIFDIEPGVIPTDIAHGIQAHAFDYTGVLPENDMDWAIYCTDQLTGLIVAAALIHPEKKLAPITVEFIMKRFNEKSFARGASREPIKMAEEKLGIPLQEFISIVLKAMQGIHTELGL